MAFGKPGLTYLLLSPDVDFVEQGVHVDRVLLVQSEADLPRTVGCPSALDKKEPAVPKQGQHIKHANTY